MNESRIRDWLLQASQTVSDKNHAAYMNLISKNVTLQGVPGDESRYDGLVQ